MPPTQTIRLLALTTDPAVERSLQALARHLPIELMAWPQPDRLAAAFVLHRPDVLLVDADLPCGAAAAAVCEVRGALCKDWVPIVLAGRDPAATQALAARLGDAVDVVLTGPIDETALAPYQNILRRMIALRRINRSAIDRVSEGVVVIDEKGTVRSFNATAERLFGWTADELVGRDVVLLMPSPHRE
ncbi:MAG: PAS domain S-box protein, partial [Ideonella sp.]|nr:PAS domain S-box protein [Ideonella sp.]